MTPSQADTRDSRRGTLMVEVGLRELGTSKGLRESLWESEVVLL